MKTSLIQLTIFVSAMLPLQPNTAGASGANQRWAIVCAERPSALETLAAREIRRYVYLRTGELLPIVEVDAALSEKLNIIVVTRKDRSLASKILASSGELEPQAYSLKTVATGACEIVLVVGGDDVGTLYGAYRLVEHLGVRFYLHGDVIPDRKIKLRFPDLAEESRPLFKLRGIQPFHDFPEGPDWWNRDDYLAVISQLPKLRMNFIGLHTYPEGRPNAEPTVWIGLREEIGEQGQVNFSYPASYQNTQRGNWGYAAKKTSDFLFGAAQLFECEHYGPQVMAGFLPQADTPQKCNVVFNRTGAMLHDAFRHARQLGIKTCVGTETPLVVPKLVAQRLNAQGKCPTNMAVIQELYEGIFQRAAQAYDPDYYWFWTPEDWTWRGAKPEEIAATTNDLFAAIAATKKVKAPFQLATCGWVLGPQQDRAMFDKILPKELALSCINREVGKTPIDKGFAEVSGRSKWAIPWLEDDPALTIPQLWAGRMRRDAADALRYGCDGLMGIHWRTRILSPNVAALAQAAWDQGEWNISPGQTPQPLRIVSVEGGKVALFTNAIAGTEDARLYQSVRYDISAYHLQIPDGPCNVTLKFCESHYKESGKRVFDVKLQGKLVEQNLDVFDRVGQNRALDLSFNGVEVTNGWLDIDFVPRVEYPFIAALSVQSGSASQNINCGGEDYKEYRADLPALSKPGAVFPRTDDFYRDWALAQFGPEVAAAAATIFTNIDGRLPRPADWVNGPGGIKPDKRPWERVCKEYEFVDELAALRANVKGGGNLERFDYWLNSFRYMRAMAQVNCTWFMLTNAMGKAKAEQDPDARQTLARETALPLRVELVRLVGEVYDYLLATISNTGELGTLANWEQHLLPGLLEKTGKDLAELLGEALPANAHPSHVYHGPTRVIVPTVRSSIPDGHGLELKVLILAEQQPRHATLYSRPLGEGPFKHTELTRMERGVYSAMLLPPPEEATGLEYYLKVVPAKGPSVYFPATAPDMNQTLVVEPSFLASAR